MLQVFPDDTFLKVELIEKDILNLGSAKLPSPKIIKSLFYQQHVGVTIYFSFHH